MIRHRPRSAGGRGRWMLVDDLGNVMRWSSRRRAAACLRDWRARGHRVRLLRYRTDRVWWWGDTLKAQERWCA